LSCLSQLCLVLSTGKPVDPRGPGERKLSDRRSTRSDSLLATGGNSPKPDAPAVRHTRMQELRTAFTYYKWHMVGTALCWFLLDVDFYANGLFNQKITSTIFSTPGHTNTALQDAYYAGILSLIGIPGYYLSVFYIEAVGRKQLQMLGFTMMALLFCICSVFYKWLMDENGGMGRKYLFLLIYALTFLFR
jgi:hypothetical protein